MPAPYLTMADIARLYRVHLRTVRRWAAEDRWRRTGTRPVRYALADAQVSYEGRRNSANRVIRHLVKRYEVESEQRTGRPRATNSQTVP